MYPDRFAMMQTQKQPELQPECPIYVHCTRRCRDRASGSMFLQVRLVNRSDSVVNTVILQVEGLNSGGGVVYTMQELILADCDARPRGIFGENKILAIDRTPVERVRVTVERVVFSSGVIWRRMPEQRLVSEEASRWKTCKCGMRNPPQQKNCELCGRAFVQAVQRLDQMPSPAEEDFPEIRVPYIPMQPPEAPAFFPEETFVPPAEPVEPEEESAGWLVVLLCVLGVVALAAAAAFLTYCVVQYRRNVL